jgi:bacterioferritin-associated ferredoxin
MYVCLCNAISSLQIGQAMRDGACRPSDVYAAFGCRAQCGGCTRTVLGIIRSGAPANLDIHANQER